MRLKSHSQLARILGWITALTTVLSFSGATIAQEKDTPPNILLVAIDDLNDWTSHLGGYNGVVHTPFMDELASMGVSFGNAHASSPICNPSRASVMTGLRPSTSGVYVNDQPWRPATAAVLTMPEYFMRAGYQALGGGKIFHHWDGYNPPECWDEYFDLWPSNRPEEPMSGITDFSISHFDWGPTRREFAETRDGRAVTWACQKLQEERRSPFFLACGIFRPHLPWYVPEEFFELYPIDQIKLPEVLNGDLQDIPKEGLEIARFRGQDHKVVQREGKWKEAVRAYLASISFADAQFGRLLRALQASPYADNTIIVLWSDHGYHLGEKEHWHKYTLWEESTRVPLIIAAPGISGGGECDRPVSLLDIYPTVLDLAGLDSNGANEGQSLRPLLENPDAYRAEPAITTFNRNQHAVRSQHWRFIQYSDGGMELYDHRSDPNEWRNLAYNPKYAEVIRDHRAWLPHVNAKPAPKRSDYIYDAETVTWIAK